MPILGSFSLEHTRIDLTDVPDAAIGDEVVIIGEQDGNVIEQNEVLIHQNIGVKAALALNVGQGIPRSYMPATTVK